jgi:hypothetical protein
LSFEGLSFEGPDFVDLGFVAFGGRFAGTAAGAFGRDFERDVIAFFAMIPV